MVDKDSGRYTPEYLFNIFDFGVSAVNFGFDKEVVSGQWKFPQLLSFLFCFISNRHLIRLTPTWNLYPRTYLNVLLISFNFAIAPKLS